jgi:hypothetical protein
MSKLLDLRNKGIEKVKVVERVIFKPRSFKYEMVRMFTVIAVVVAVGFGISNADDLNPFSDKLPTPEPAPETTKAMTGIYGFVTNISDNHITLDNSKGSRYEGVDIFNVNLINLQKIETNTDNPVTLLLSDINIGDTIIAKGYIEGDNLDAYEITSFSATSSKTIIVEVATSTATTTDATASSTDETSTTTEATSTPETDSETSIIEDILNTAGDLVEKVKEAAGDVADLVTGNTDTETPAVEPAPETTPTPEPETQDSPEPPANPEPII